MLFPLAVPMVAIGAVVIVAWIERHVGLHTVWRTGDVDYGCALLLVGTTTFALATSGLARLEQLERPRVRDHVRHSAILYAFIGPCCALLVASYLRSGRGIAWGLAAAGTATLGLAIVVNALTHALLAKLSRRGT
ncbi:MAG: hypothetical protein A2V77_10590 [Anaeromyxobacter sp. RBG_16_69_14]|nr:MAG: hypothetical protein A2V77_10590 [Anaeromyxobacter sp. RBG_16_69_14]